MALQLVTDGSKPATEKALRFAYPAGSYKPSGRIVGGGGMKAAVNPASPANGLLYEPSAPSDGATNIALEMSVRLAPDFDCRKGGKLHGLYGGDHTSGGEFPNGTNGWSIRFHFRQGCWMEVYAYLPLGRANPCNAPPLQGGPDNEEGGDDSPGAACFACSCVPQTVGVAAPSPGSPAGSFHAESCTTGSGVSLGRASFRLVPGQWQTLLLHVVLNSVADDGSVIGDGSVTLYSDGQLALHQPSLVFRTTRQLAVDGLYLNTFFGGGDGSYATPVATWSEVAAISLWAGIPQPKAPYYSAAATAGGPPGTAGGDSASKNKRALSTTALALIIVGGIASLPCAFAAGFAAVTALSARAARNNLEDRGKDTEGEPPSPASREAARASRFPQQAMAPSLAQLPTAQGGPGRDDLGWPRRGMV
eukprot:jgi/Mesvir1/9054/Mv21331-RA.1